MMATKFVGKESDRQSTKTSGQALSFAMPEAKGKTWPSALVKAGNNASLN
jgi:hypothetical protein